MRWKDFKSLVKKKWVRMAERRKRLREVELQLYLGVILAPINTFNKFFILEFTFLAVLIACIHVHVL